MKTVLLTTMIILSQSSYALAAKKLLQPQNSKIEFEAVGRPSMMKVKGKGASADGQLAVENNLVSGLLKVDLAKLDTGIELRNEHMKDKYLEVQKYPTAELTLNPIQLPADWDLGKPYENSFTGKFKLHGVEQPISGKFKIQSNQALSAQFEIKLSDYKIDIPSYLGVTIADVVKVNTEFTVKAE